MSLVCPASSRVLALDEGDLREFRHKPQRTKPMRHSIDIRLQCEISYEDEIYPNGRLAINEWNHSTTYIDLCGVCNFCRLLLYALQQTLDSKGCEWNPAARTIGNQEFSPIRLNIMLKELRFPINPTGSTDHDSFLPSGLDIVMLGGITEIFHKMEADSFAESSVESQIEISFEFFGKADDEATKSLNIYRRPLQHEPLSPQNVVKIRNWMDYCDQHHTRCCAPDNFSSTETRSQQPVFLPTRLLMIGRDDKDIRLVVTNHEDFETNAHKKVSYMALSYCWGSPSTSKGLLTTTLESMESRLKGVDFDILPQVFKDAVRVGRLLQIEYIWIDSLCIIQDDNVDWERESSKMAEIFSNANLTVIAAQGFSCHDSFLKRQLYDAKVIIPASWTSSSGHKFQDCQVNLRFRRPGTDKMCQFVNGRWVSRGWTFQEERLAKRALIFGEEKIFLDCRTSEWAEDLDTAKKRPAWVSSMIGLDGEKICEYNLGGDKSKESRSRYEHWEQLCYHYTFRELTVAADKLPAISGIARRFAQEETSDGEYLAGLWRNDLMYSLFWHSTPGCEEAKTYRAPSWSWASVDGRISWLDRHSRQRVGYYMYCTIEDAQTTPLGLDPLGAIRDGYLTVLGDLYQVESLTWVRDSVSKFHWRFRIHGKAVAKGIPDSDTIAQTSLGLHHGDIKAMPFLNFKRDINGRNVLRGLVLKAMELKRGDDRNIFRRVGVFETEDEEAINHVGLQDRLQESQKQRITII